MARQDFGHRILSNILFATILNPLFRSRGLSNPPSVEGIKTLSPFNKLQNLVHLEL